ncbi:MAG: hypothetical protein K6F15_06115 [Treponema sp.]|nr:hypothetical protein [Treponema sp.]
MFTINGKTGWVHKDCVYVDRGGFNVYDYCVDDPFEKTVDDHYHNNEYMYFVKLQ